MASKIAFDQGNNLVLQKNIENAQKLDTAMSRSYQKHLDDKVKAYRKTEAELESIRKHGTKEQIEEARKAAQAAYAERLSAEQDLERVKDIALQAAQKRELAAYRSMGPAKKLQYQKELAEKLALEKKNNEQILAGLNDRLATATDAEKTAIKAQMDALKNETDNITSDLGKAQSTVAALKKNPLAVMKNAGALAKEFKAGAIEKGTAAVEKGQDLKEQIAAKKQAIEDEAKAENDLQKRLEDARKRGNKSEVAGLEAQLKKSIEAKQKADKELINLEKEQTETRKTIMKEGGKEMLADAAENLKKAGNKIFKQAADSIDTNLDSMFGMQGRMMGRLQGSAVNWKKSVDEVSDTIGFSGIVSKKSVVAKMVELVDSGVAYNLEMRAFLAETSANIASTFDATNGTLLRLIRLQQQDTTAARLGLEATLTKLFNSYFEDSSYLADQVSDNVAAAILDATAALGRDEGLAFEYAVQKWLGSLYSLGASSDVVSTLATGINYLATGNVSKLSNDSALQTLLAMGAAKANKSYASLLTGTLTAEDTNELNILPRLQQIKQTMLLNLLMLTCLECQLQI